MLPLMSNAKRNLIAGVAAAAMLAAAAPPAMAWGVPEQQFVAGAATGLVLGAVINSYNRPVYARPRGYYYAAPAYRYRQPVVYAPAPAAIDASPVAAGFNSFPIFDRQHIQSRLGALGLYQGPIDGAFGPGTMAAIQDLAQKNGTPAALNTPEGVSGMLGSL